MSTIPTAPYQPTRYYRRRRTLPDAMGHALDTLTTRYTYAYFKRPAKGPRGGRAYKTCARAVYYADGVMYRAANLEVSPGEWVNVLVPCENATLHDCHKDQTRDQGRVPLATVRTDSAGRVVEVVAEVGTLWTPADGLEYLEDLLDLAR